jgi:O-antigen ligase
MAKSPLDNSIRSVKWQVQRININLTQVSHILFYLLMLSIFFLPALRISDYLPAIRLEDIIVIVLFFLNYFQYKVPKHTYLVLLTIYLCVITLSIIFNESLLYTSNIFEVFKVIKMIILYMFFSFYFRSSRNNFSKLNIFLQCSFWLLVIINLIQYLDLFHFNQLLGSLYAPPEQLDVFMLQISTHSATKRMLGLMGNPNCNAVLFLFFTCYYLARYDYRKRNIISLITSVVLVLLTQSRTGFISLIIIFIIFMLKDMNLRKIGTGLIILSFLALVITIVSPEYISALWDRPLKKITSLTIRFDIWFVLIEMVKDRWLIGMGPFKEFFYANTLHADNEYVLNYFRYGICGLVLYSSLLLYPVVSVFKRRFKLNQYTFFGGMFFMVLLINALTNAPMSEPRLQVLAILCASLIFIERCHQKLSDSGFVNSNIMSTTMKEKPYMG